MLGLTRSALWNRSLLFARTASTDFVQNNGSYMVVLSWAYFSSMALRWGAQIASTNHKLSD